MSFRVKFGKGMLRSFGKVLPEKGFFSKKLRLHWGRMINKGISKQASIHKGAVLNGDGNNIVLEEHSTIGVKCSVGSNIFIGKHVMMGPECIVLTQNHKFDSKELKFDGFEDKPVYIGEYTWIGTRVIILPGAKIGKHCIIGAGSVVPNKEYPDYSLIAGNPAVVKKMLK